MRTSLTPLLKLLAAGTIIFSVADGKAFEPSSDEPRTKTYRVADIVEAARRGDSGEVMNDLVRVTNAVVFPERTEEASRRIEAHENSLVVTQSQANHERIELCLTALRQIRRLYAHDPAKIHQLCLDGRTEHAARTLESLLEAQIAEVDYLDAPLEQVVADISKQARIPLRLDVRENASLTFAAKDVTLRTVVDRIAQESRSAWCFCGGEILITNSVSPLYRVECYPVRDLVASVKGRTPVLDRDELIALVARNVLPESWDLVGGWAALEVFQDALIVLHTREAHDEIGQLLNGIRRSRQAMTSDDGGTRLPVATFVSPHSTSPAEEAIFRELDMPTALDCAEMPLNDVARLLAARHNIDIWMDDRALEMVGISSDCPVTRKLKGMTLRTTLHLLLRDLELTYYINDDSLVITTPECNETNPTVGVYPIFDLLGSDRRKPDRGDDYDKFIDGVRSCVAPESWAWVGGPGEVHVVWRAGCLVIAQTMDVHEKLQRLFSALRLSADWKNAGGPGTRPRLTATADERLPAASHVARAIEERTTVDFVDAPLSEAIRKLAQRHRVHIELDTRATDFIGIKSDSPITLQLKNVRLRSVLWHLAKGRQMAWFNAGEFIDFTSIEAAEYQLATVVYPVFDLLQWHRMETASAEDYQRLVELVKRTTVPWSWDEVGGPGSIECFPSAGAIAVSQTAELQDEIAAFLRTYREFQDLFDQKMGVRIPRSVVVAQNPAAPARIATIKRQLVDLDFKATPLDEVAREISRKYKIPVLLDNSELEVARFIGISATEKITLRAEKEPLDSVLQRMLTDVGLSWIYRHEAVQITSQAAADNWYWLRFYPAIDFVPVSEDKREDVRRRMLPALIERFETAEFWPVRGDGSIGAITNPPALLISQPRRTHEQIEPFLDTLPRPYARSR